MADRTMPGAVVPVIAAIGGLALAAVMVHAALAGDLHAEGSVLTDLLWGRVLLVDVYLGFALFGAWIGWREGLGPRGIAWLVALFVLGNVIACLYLLLAWWRARGDGRAFWHGSRR